MDVVTPPNPGEPTDERAARVEALLRDVESANPRSRSEAVRALGNLNACPEAVVRLVRDRNEHVREAAAFALGDYVGIDAALRDSVGDELMHAIDDWCEPVCCAAIKSLGRLEISAAREQIADSLDNDSPAVLASSIYAYSHLDNEGLLSPRFPVWLTHPHKRVRIAAIEAIGRLGLQEHGMALLGYLRHMLGTPGAGDVRERCAYVTVLGKLRINEAAPDLAEIAARIGGSRTAAVLALMQLDHTVATEPISELLKDGNVELRRKVLALLRKADHRKSIVRIRVLLRDPDAEVRKQALAIVAEWSDLEALLTVRFLAFHDQNAFVRAMAIGSFARLAGTRAVPDLMDLARDANSVIRCAVANAFAILDQIPREAEHLLKQWLADPVTALAATEALSNTRVVRDLQDYQELESDRALYPAAMKSEANTLRHSLDRWRAHLLNVAGQSDLQQVARLERALTSLIDLLNLEADRQGIG